MPACRTRISRSLVRAAVPMMVIVLAGCATSLRPPSAPDESVLAPAEQALAKARAAHADDFAPQEIDAARRRITTARDILFGASKADRPLTGQEDDRVEQLVSGAQLDARAALVQTQARAVAAKLAELRSQGGSARSGGVGGGFGAGASSQTQTPGALQ